MKKLALILLASCMPLGVVAAAEHDNLIEIETDDQVIPEFEATVDKLEDMEIYGISGGTIGEIEDVLGTTDGKATAFAVEVGGFLGIGDTEVVVPFDRVDWEDGQLRVDMDAEEIDALERWD